LFWIECVGALLLKEVDLNSSRVLWPLQFRLHQCVISWAKSNHDRDKLFDNRKPSTQTPPDGAVLASAASSIRWARIAPSPFSCWHSPPLSPACSCSPFPVTMFKPSEYRSISPEPQPVEIGQRKKVSDNPVGHL